MSSVEKSKRCSIVLERCWVFVLVETDSAERADLSSSRSSFDNYKNIPNV